MLTTLCKACTVNELQSVKRKLKNTHLRRFAHHVSSIAVTNTPRREDGNAQLRYRYSVGIHLGIRGMGQNRKMTGNAGIEATNTQ
jgi:hypothetical protein